MSTQFQELPFPATQAVLAEDINTSAAYTAVKGVMLALDSTMGANSGKAYKATDSADRTVVGFCVDTGRTGKIAVALKRIYRLNNSGTSPLAKKDCGKLAYVEDSTTVKASGNAVAGTIVDVDSYGVFVWVGVGANVK